MRLAILADIHEEVERLAKALEPPNMAGPGHRPRRVRPVYLVMPTAWKSVATPP